MKKIFISCKESIIENNRSFYGCFSIGPFTEGQSLTIANALRRTLLSECPGLAIISVLIEDVNHEYSTLPGVRDSVLDILLNLKEVVLKKENNPWLLYKKKGIGSVYNSVGSSFFKPMVGYLKVKGPGIVRAKDLRLPPFIQMVDPDQYIATLSENGSLNMKVVIMEGKNYIIQKNNEFMDYSMVKKRRTLLKSLKDLVNKSTFGSTSCHSFGLGTQKHPSKKSVEEVKKDIFEANNTTGLQSRKESKGQLTTPLSKIKNEAQNEYPPFNSFRKASPLNIDAVFNPIKKVNYIIEVNNNKIVDYANDKYSFIDDISNFIESGELYRKNFPFLTNTYSSLLPLFQSTSTDLNKTSSILEKEDFINSLIEYVEDYSTEELWTSSRSLHPLRKEGLLHTVMLEIWTNGSIHPREALSMAFSNLTSLFLNFEKTKIFSPMYKDVSSYKKCLTTSTFLPKNFNVTNHSSDKSFMLEEKNLNEKENLDISVLNLNLRTYTLLKRANINTLKDFSLLSKENLLTDFSLDLFTVEVLLKNFSSSFGSSFLPSVSADHKGKGG